VADAPVLVVRGTLRNPAPERLGTRVAPRPAPIGRDLVLLRYLYKGENFPVVWYFTFYRTTAAGETGPGTWRTIAVRFDTDLELLGFVD
jgi:hypothetical protein